MAIDLDKIILSSDVPAFRNSDSGTFTVGVSGSLGAAATGTWSGSAAFTRSNQMVRLYVSQDPVPVDAFTVYSSGAMLPCPPWGMGGNAPLINVKCSVAGDPSVTSITAAFSVQFTSSGVGVTITVSNPNPGTMSLTNTTFTFRYIAFLPTQ